MVDGAAEETDLRPVEHHVGDDSPGGLAEEVLRVRLAASGSTGNLGAELDDVVVEERDADLERVRHRRPVEVVEHVVDEAELAVQHERPLDVPGVRRRQPIRDQPVERATVPATSPPRASTGAQIGGPGGARPDRRRDAIVCSARRAPRGRAREARPRLAAAARSSGPGSRASRSTARVCP